MLWVGACARAKRLLDRHVIMLVSVPCKHLFAACTHVLFSPLSRSLPIAGYCHWGRVSYDTIVHLEHSMLFSWCPSVVDVFASIDK